MESFSVIFTALDQLWVQMVVFVPKVIVALAIWLIGKWLINLGVSLIRKIDIKGIKLDNYLVGILSGVVFVVGKILLVLIVLDYLGVGRSIVGAVANGLTLTIAIALGLAFGKALEEDAKGIVHNIKSHLGKKSA